MDRRKPRLAWPQRIAHELRLESPLTRRGVARIHCEALPRAARAKGLPAANTFSRNEFNPMPHHVFVTDACAPRRSCHPSPPPPSLAGGLR